MGACPRPTSDAATDYLRDRCAPLYNVHCVSFLLRPVGLVCCGCVQRLGPWGLVLLTPVLNHTADKKTIGNINKEKVTADTKTQHNAQ